jgi:hypothetical protein
MTHVSLAKQFGNNNVQNFFFTVVMPLFAITIPGALLFIGGSLLALASFGGWTSIIMRAMASNGAIGLPGPVLPSGVSLAAAYFVGFGGGGIIAVVGGSMVTRAGTPNPQRVMTWLGHAVIAVIVAAGTFHAAEYVAGGVAYDKLLPQFSSCPWELKAAESGRPLDHTRSTLTIDEWRCEKSRKK